MWDENSRPDASGDDWLEGSVDQPFTDWSSLPQSTEEDHPFDVPEGERYRWVSDIARGGMGRIDSVEDLRLGRVVARKRSLRVDGDVHRNDRRMSREAWITAQLEHPGIVAVHNVGRDDGGGLFFTMRLVRGKTLSSEMKAAQDPVARLALIRHVRDACEAVGFAHHQGMVHRDLKPQNIMVGRFGETQVMDWGLATPVPGPAGDWWRKLFPPQLGVSTVHGAVLGTAWYLSPEQVSGREVGPRSDVWSLGVILYELLTGERPFQGSDFRTVTTSIATSQPVPLSTREPALPPGLVAICERAMRPEPADRYADGKALADALTAWMAVGTGRTSVDAVAPPRGRSRLWGPALVLGIGGLGALGWMHQQQGALLNASEQRTATVIEDLVDARSRLAGASFADGQLDVAEDWARQALAYGPAPAAVGVLMGTALSAKVSEPQTSDLPPCLSRAVDATATWMTCVTEQEVQQWSTQPLEQVWSVDLEKAVRPRTRPDGTAMVRKDDQVFVFGTRGQVLRASAVGGGGQLYYDSRTERLWKADHELLVSEQVGDVLNPRYRSGELRWHLAADCGHLLAVSESSVVTSCGTDLRVLEADSLRTIRIPEFDEQQHVDALLTDGRSVWMGGGRGGLARVDLAEDQLVWQSSVSAGSLQAVVPSTDGKWLVVRHDLTEIDIVSAESGARVASLRDEHIDAPMTFDGEFLRVYDAELYSYSVALTDSQPHVMNVGPGVTSLAFSPDGASLAVGHGRGVRKISIQSGAVERKIPTGAVVKDVIWARSGDLFAAMSTPLQGDDGQKWNVLRERPDATLERLSILSTGFRRMVMLGSRYLIWNGYSLGPGSWDLSEWAPGPRVAQVGGVPTDIESSHSGDVVAWVGTEGVWWLTLDTMTPRRLVMESEAHTIALSPDGRRVFLADTHGLGCVRADDGSSCWESGLSAEQIPIDLAVSPDGRFLVAGMRSGASLVLSTDDGQALAMVEGHTDKVAAVTFSPDGGLLATGSWDGSVRIWSTDPLTESVARASDGPLGHGASHTP